jgi:hypothetical protein
MHAFGSVEQVERVLGELAARQEPLAVRLERQPGRKEARWAQRLATAPGGVTAAPDSPEPAVQVAEGLLRRLVAALGARDVEGVLGLFHPDAVLLGSGDGERADGHVEIRALVPQLFQLPAALGPEWGRLTAERRQNVLWFLMAGSRPGAAEAAAAGHRVSGVVVSYDGRHVLAQLHVSRLPG